MVEQRQAKMLDERVHQGLVQAHTMVSESLSSLYKRHGISSVQFEVLRILRNSDVEGQVILSIATQLSSRVPDITRLIDRLEDNGIVRRRRSENARRVILIKPTRKGLRIVHELTEPTRRTYKRLFGHINPKDLELLELLLYKATAKSEPKRST